MSDPGLTFKVTENHIKLIKAMCVRWDDSEFGAPAIDSKRPYGNSSVLLDIVEVLGVCSNEDRVDEYINKYGDILTEIHKQTQTALEILLSNLSIQPGMYTRSSAYSDNWSYFGPLDGELPVW